MSINWNDIRPLQNSQNEGFEELVCQLARHEQIINSKKFIRKGKPDAGVECFWILENDDEWAWQAKFFTSSLSITQWGQLDSSIKTVLAKHPKLKKYIVAIPTDPSDARLEGEESMLQKWDKRVEKWKKWANDKGLNVEFKAWWSSDLIERLQKPVNAGLTYFWFNKEEFTDEWCIEQNEFAITELGNRYTPEINVELEISKIFSGISRDKKFQQHMEHLFDLFLIKGKKVISENLDLEKYMSKLQELFDMICELFFSIKLTGIEHIPYNNFDSLVDSIRETTDLLNDHYLSEERKLQEEEKLQEKASASNHYQKYGDEIYHLREFNRSLYDFQEFILSTTARLANHPILLLYGEAGIGKSHLIADVVNNRNFDHKQSLFLLGQHFVTDEDPWTQIFRKLHIRCSIDEFLGALSAKAMITRSRFIIFIDAINEGRGKYFWDKNVKSFIQKILKYEWLGLVFTVRSSYKDLIFPKDEMCESFIIQYGHDGFMNVEYEASKIFFNNYNIELPSVPLLHPEFQNPLFLKLFCEGLNKSGCTKIPDGLQGITSIIEFFVSSINIQLSKPDCFSYPANINVVKKAIEALISEKIAKNLHFVPYEDAFILVDRVSSVFLSERGFLERLISEGILSKNLFWKAENTYEEGVYLAYERFEDHLTVNFLLEKYSDLESSFAPAGELHYLIKDENACYMYKGLIEAFSIQLPEKKGKEFYEYAPHIKEEYPVIESFIQSLLWRKIDTISEKLIDYVNAAVFSYQGTRDLFWDTLLSITAVPGHYFNAYSLHNHLMKFSMSDRDARWTKYLKNQFHDGSAVKRLIDWGWNDNDKDHISDESIKLASIALSWFHASTNRQLRDCATKALICLLENRIYVLIEVLKLFETVNDPYVYERLFAVAYGCSVRTNQKDSLPELSEYIYETIFNKDEVYPYILLRDYARGVIEFTSYLGYDLSFDIQKSRPPYKSSFVFQFPSDKEIKEKYKLDYKSSGFKDHYWGQNSILSSMATESRSMYGDFGRYTFESALSSWNLDANLLSNLAIEWIFERYGYDVEKHGKYDRSIGSGRGRDTEPHERIGKKYQWLALYEMLARVSDNCEKYNEWSSSNQEKEPYQGPWSPCVRDIDPTTTIKNTGTYGKEITTSYWWTKEQYSNWDLSSKDWINTSDDLPDPAHLINVVDENGEDWLIVEGFPEWEEPKELGNERWDKPHKRMWYQIRSYLVEDNDYLKLREWAIQQDYMGRWMPQNHDKYEIFSREYYWSPAYEYSEGTELREVCDPTTDEFIASVRVTTESFLWEEEFDNSKEETIRFLKPCKYIYEKMQLSYSKREGEFTNENGEVVCFAPSVYYNSNSYLLIKKEPFLRFLQENNLKIIWTILGEKNIIGGRSNTDEYVGRLEVSGAFYLENNQLGGRLNPKLHK
jgi:hypothetical protein